MESDKHPRFRRVLILPGEDAAAFDALVVDFYRHFTPEGAVQRSLVDVLIYETWSIRRLQSAITALQRSPLKNLSAIDSTLQFLDAKERSYARVLKQLVASQRRRQPKSVPTRKRGELASFRQQPSTPRRAPSSKTPEGEWIH